MSKLYQYLLDCFSRFSHQMEGICVNSLDPVQFFRFLKGRWHGNQFCGKIVAKLPTPCTEMECDIATWNVQINSENDAAIGLLCVKFVKFGLVVFVSVFHKYLLEGDTMAPSGLYARLCHAFLVEIYFQFEIRPQKTGNSSPCNRTSNWGLRVYLRPFFAYCGLCGTAQCTGCANKKQSPRKNAVIRLP